MKLPLLFSLTLCALAQNALAEDRIYRCGNEYTNTVSEAQAKNCKLVSGGNVTIVQAIKPGPSMRPATSTLPGQRVDASEQRAKDSDARMILEAELKKAEARQEELIREYNKGEPEKLGPETRNNQKYLDRVAELKASISRNASDIEGIKRELGRVPAGSSTSASK
jgi:hypothetical protein